MTRHADLITAAMIEVGSNLIQEHREELSSASLAERVYLAMAAERQRRQSPADMTRDAILDEVFSAELFKVTSPSGKMYRVFADGRKEGESPFERGSMFFNGAPSMIRRLMHHYESKEKESSLSGAASAIGLSDDDGQSQDSAPSAPMVIVICQPKDDE